MSSMDDRISALLAADAPSARDAMFRIEVMRRLERRALLRRSLAVGLAGALGLVLLALAAPLLPDAREPAVQGAVCILATCAALAFAYAPRRGR
jgi:hypothetical protein